MESSTRKWVVRLGSLFVFNIVVLTLIIVLIEPVRAGRSFLGSIMAVAGAGVVLTLATVWIKPALSKALGSAASNKGATMSAGGRRAIAYLAVFAVAFVIWLLTVLLTAINVTGWFWGYVLPPLALLIAWFIYDQIDDRIEREAGKLYDAADRKLDTP